MLVGALFKKFGLFLTQVYTQHVNKKAESFLSISWSHIGGVEEQFHALLTAARTADAWLTSSPDRSILGKEFRYLSNRKLGEPQTGLGGSGEDTNLSFLTEVETQTVQQVA